MDIVIHPQTEERLRTFIKEIPKERAYVDLSTALDALRTEDMFNIIDMDTGWKADLILRKSRSFSIGEFERRRRVEWLGLPLYVASPEDVVLTKLEWSRLSGGSERQRRDIVGILDSLGDKLDLAYIESWLDELHVRAEWNHVQPMTRREA
ncbi:MAG: hypothetical protein AAGE52_06195 [Myxococcota bacterium]